jgi:YebC/PmpR family DNA-binding regulatory protein
MAGHSKWANIKHKKARMDAKRGVSWSKCAKAIIVAAKNGGDPATNLTLRYAIEEAKYCNMPKDTIAKSIKKGTGELQAASYESVIYEGYGVNGVAILLEILTDKRTRTAPEVKKIFEKNGGNMGTTGCVSYIFASKGQFLIAKQQADEETLMNIALDAGAEDILDEEEFWQVLSEPTEFIAVKEALQAAGIECESAAITMIPNTTVTCTGNAARKILTMVELFEENDDVQKVHSNFDIPDEEMAALDL